MLNLVIFTMSVSLGWIVWLIWKGSTNLKGHLTRLAVLSVLFMPFNIDGNVWTIAGNGEAEKNFSSVISIYQNTGQNAFTFFAPFSVQHAKGNAGTAFGIAGYQKADTTGFGFGVGVGIYQNADTRANGPMIGISFYQKAGNEASTGLGVTFVQKAGDRTRTFATLSTLDSN